ncbi:Bifunctional NADP phosphatase/NAD kinase [Candidatus Burarchaeum australiense]|nr:Bifunctional NADP phosphatase/NAD kinase [Candidatus Burarchaeum australiense]
MRIKRVAIAPNPRKRWAHSLARELHAFLAERGISVTHARQHADLLITIGGDGTILHEKRHSELPIFGIGSETSFVCQARRDNWRPILSKALARPRVDPRAQLASALNGRQLEDAMNEVFIRNSDHRVLTFDLRVNGRKFHFTADGVIFSTPTGSTAYAYSAGGFELKPSSRKFEVVALAPYRRAFKPLVVREGARCKLIVRTKQPAIAVIDGQFCHVLKPGVNTLVVKKSKRSVRLLR